MQLCPLWVKKLREEKQASSVQLPQQGEGSEETRVRWHCCRNLY